MSEPIPIPVRRDILDKLDLNVGLVIEGQPVREGIVALLMHLDHLIHQHPDISLDQCIGLLKAMEKRRKN